jgi:regulator of sirC expression with transglutaminase-like and TPR domain
MDDLSFRDELRQTPIDVPRAALRFARGLAYPALEVADYLRRIDELAGGARSRLTGARSVFERAKALADYLFVELAFRGNAVEYGDPRNSYLNEVLDRRLGIPITLSALYVAVATRLRLPAYGVGLPGHFIVGIRDRTGALHLDPFHGGASLTRADCARLVETTSGYKGPFVEGWLAPAAPRDILGRMLNNLRLAYAARELWPPAIVAAEHLSLVYPNRAETWRDLGLLHLGNGALYPAARYLERYLRLHPKAADALQLRQALAGRFDEWARLN